MFLYLETFGDLTHSFAAGPLKIWGTPFPQLKTLITPLRFEQIYPNFKI